MRSHESSAHAASAAATGSSGLDFAPFRWTQRDRAELPVRVEGELPSWLRGQLVRTGPGVLALSAPHGGASWQAAHWFDGLALIYAFTLADRVAFRQRPLGSATASELARGQAATASFGTAMRRTWWQRLLQPVPRVTDNANVNVIPWQGQWLAMTESPHQHVLGEDLATRGLYEYRDELPRTLSPSAHPHFDYARHALVNVGMTFGPKHEVWVYRQQADGRERVVEGKLAFKRIPYLHTFGLSARHAVLVDHPLRVNPLRLAFSNMGFIQAFRWQPHTGTRLWKLERESGRWTDYVTEPLFCFHVVNTFDDGDDVVVDFLAYDDARVVTAFGTERLAQQGLPSEMARLVRARLRAGRRHVELEELSRQRFELPNIPYRAQNGVRHDAVWGVTFDDPARQTGAMTTAIVRVDMQSGSVARFSEPNMSYGEPLFVPRPGASDATDGVVLAVGSHARDEQTSLTVLDAGDLTPRARCVVNLSLPLGLHGSFLPH